MDRPALEDAQDAEHNRRADRDRHHHAQLKGIRRAHRIVVGNGPGFRGDLGRLRSNGDQGRFRDRGAKTQAKGKGQQRSRAPLAGKSLCNGLAEGKETAFESLDEERQAGDHADQANGDAPEIWKGLLQHHELEERDDDDDGCQIAQRIDDPPQYRTQGPGHGVPLSLRPSASICGSPCK